MPVLVAPGHLAPPAIIPSSTRKLYSYGPNLDASARQFVRGPGPGRQIRSKPRPLKRTPDLPRPPPIPSDIALTTPKACPIPRFESRQGLLGSTAGRVPGAAGDGPVRIASAGARPKPFSPREFQTRCARKKAAVRSSADFAAAWSKWTPLCRAKA